MWMRFLKVEPHADHVSKRERQIFGEKKDGPEENATCECEEADGDESEWPPELASDSSSSNLVTKTKEKNESETSGSYTSSEAEPHPGIQELDEMLKDMSVQELRDTVHDFSIGGPEEG